MAGQGWWIEGRQGRKPCLCRVALKINFGRSVDIVR